MLFSKPTLIEKIVFGTGVFLYCLLTRPIHTCRMLLKGLAEKL